MINVRTISKIWLLILVFFYGLFFVLPTSAADVKIPQDCWTQEQCVGQAGNETAKYFFKPGDSAFQTYCGGGSGSSSYGKCYVTPEKVELSVPIPDVTGGATLTTVTQFPDYLKKIYTFFVWAIAIVAVAYLGFGGYEWIAAAGSAEQIGKAKDTIQGAIMGLLLALGSWVLLNTINSRLVEFDYIRVERIRPSSLAHFCSEAEGSQQWIKVGDTNSVKVNAADTWCNSEYYSSLNVNNTCMGLKCGENSYCMPKTGSSDFECVDIMAVKNRCVSQEKSRESCDLFDQYIQTIAKAYPSSPLNLVSCRFTIYDMGLGLGIIDVGILAPNSCSLTGLQTTDTGNYLKSVLRPSINIFTYDRIKCNEASSACLKDGQSRVLEYFAKNSIPIGDILVSSKIEVTCSDTTRAGKGADSICLMSNQSICSVNKPDFSIDFISYNRLDVSAHDYPTFEWEEKSCSEFPPENGTCQNNEKCWIMKVNYYEPVL
jgi:hypothetical protein